jgi:formylglycine-generating enzyme required for sulfatase activity
MSACRSIFLALTALILTGNSLAQSDFIDLGKSRIIVVKIPAGIFGMGSEQVIHADDAWKPCPACAPRNEVERPMHRVTISKDFWMGQFDVTQKQWQEVMGNNPSGNRTAGPDAPVDQVSWKDVQFFLVKANAMQTRWTLRLPTEAEWEYAARAGSIDETYGPLDTIAWYKGNGGGTTHPVGQKKPNDFGLYDMLGNVWQWCQGWFSPYPRDPVTDPEGAPSGDLHPTRGGCYYCDAVHERAARRKRDLEEHSSLSIGFRIVAVPRKTIAPK